ncbi:uncharacterized protein LOC132029483 [Lycium ferocissimum]|uniref:uncharacterized protein LOC132029483 n=1 Tax=Lycium ferocissimum TaxID=112874 RepID=UPI0028161121|nr:uncharacterized protein LOC132029483 [Lycium ferocissimum]
MPSTTAEQSTVAPPSLRIATPPTRTADVQSKILARQMEASVERQIRVVLKPIIQAQTRAHELFQTRLDGFQTRLAGMERKGLGGSDVSEFRVELDKLKADIHYHSGIDMAPFDTPYGRRYRSLIGWIDAFENRQKEYADRKVRDLEFMVVLLKVSPTKGVMRIGKKGKLSPRFIGPLEIFNRVRDVAYELALPPRYHGDGSFIIHWDSFLLDENMSYEEEPIAISDREVRKLRLKEIASVKVQ